MGGADARRWSASYSRDPVVMIVMSVRAASRDALRGWYGRERYPSVRLCFSSVLASRSLCNITTTSPNELVTVMQISPTGLVSSPAVMPGRCAIGTAWMRRETPPGRERKDDRHAASPLRGL